MGALLQKAVLLEKGNVWVGTTSGNAVDLGAARKVRFTGKLISQQIDSDNRGTILDHGRLNGEIEFDWLEPASVSNMEVMFKGLVTKSTIAGSSTPVSGEVTASGSWSYLQMIFFVQQDGAQVIPTAITVTGGTDGLLTQNTHYFVAQDPGTKKWGFYVKSVAGVTTLNQSLTVTYTTTPNTGIKMVGGTTLTQTALYMKIVGPLETDATKTRTIELATCKTMSDMLLEFVDVETANSVGIMPVKAVADKGSLWTWTDQVNTN